MTTEKVRCILLCSKCGRIPLGVSEMVPGEPTGITCSGITDVPGKVYCGGDLEAVDINVYVSNKDTAIRLSK